MQKASPSESFAHGSKVGDRVVDEELSEGAGEGEAAEVEEALRVAQHEGRRRQQLTRPAQRDQAQDRCRGVDACRPNRQGAVQSPCPGHTHALHEPVGATG